MVGRGRAAVATTADTAPEKCGEVGTRGTGQGRRHGNRQEEVAICEEGGAQAAMNVVTIYHNPRCSTSRKTLELIRAKGIAPRIVEYLKTPPSSTELDRILSLLKMEPRELIRKKEDEYKTLKLDRSELTRQELVLAMVEHPILIERPIVLSKGKAALGRPPENVSSIL